MPSLKEIFENAQKTGQVSYTYFGGGSNTAPFNQTSLPFENGGNGFVKEPFIQLGYDPKLKFTTKDPTNTINKALATSRDAVRISKFLMNFPNGPVFLGKQATLQLTNPDTSYDTVAGTNNAVGFINKALQLDGPRLYNPLGTNTIAQVGVAAAGLHFTRHGLSPTNDTGYISLNSDDAGKILSRVNLYYDKLKSGETLLLKYQSGPDSTYSVGQTSTSTYRDSFGLNTGQTDKDFITPDNLDQYNGFIPWGLQDIQDYSWDYNYDNLPYDLDFFSNKKIQDFRQKTNNVDTDNYPSNNVHSRIGVTTGQSAIGNPNTVDSINVLKITPSAVFYAKSGTASETIDGEDVYSKGYNVAETAGQTGGHYGRDIIKFRIEVLNNDNPIETVKNAAGKVVDRVVNTDVLAFRAYIDSFSDNFTANWKEVNYMGRGESFYAYEKFNRKIDLSFHILAHSEEEMSSLYTKLNYLMSSFTPDYNKNLQMRGNYVYLTVGDYIYRQPGIFDSMAIGDILTAPWEIALNEPEQRKNKEGSDFRHYEVPKYLKITLSFKPIHNFLPRRMTSQMTDHTATFVTPNHHLLASRYNRYLPSEAPVTQTKTNPKQPTPAPKPKKKTIAPPPQPKPPPVPKPKPTIKDGGAVPKWEPIPKQQTMLRRGANDTIDTTRTKYSKFVNPNPDAAYWNNVANRNKRLQNWGGFGGGDGFNGGGAGGSF